MSSRRNTRITQLEDDITALERLASEAAEAESFSPAVGARSRIPTLRAELHRLRELDALSRTKDPLARIRATRRLAEREGSWQAVARLASVEADLEVRLAEVKAADEVVRLKNLDSEVLFEMIGELVGALPEHFHDRLIEQLERRPG